MEHLTVVLDGNYGAYGNNEQFISLLEDICYCLNAYAVNSFNIFDLLISTSTSTRIVAQNYRLPLKYQFCNIKMQLQAVINQMIQQITPEDRILCLTPTLAKVSLLQNKSQSIKQHILSRKFVLVLSSDTINADYNSEHLLQTLYHLISLDVQSYVIFFSPTPEPGVLSQLCSSTSGAVIQASLDNSRAILHVLLNTLPRTDDEAKLIRTNSGLKSGNSNFLKYYKSIKSFDLVWNNAGVERKTQIGPNSCFCCGNTFQGQKLQFFFMCRYCLRLYCQKCLKSIGNLCKCHVQIQKGTKNKVKDQNTDFILNKKIKFEEIDGIQTHTIENNMAEDDIY